LGRFRRAHIYTPPGYEKGNESYPVLYLLHGASDSDASWSTVGKAGLVADNLIAAGKIPPMLIVMPMGHTGEFAFGPDRSNLQKQMTEFEQDFVTDLRPFIESNYRLKEGREHRAIAGLSMGGAQTLNIAFGNLGDYSHVGVFSSGVFGIEGGGGPAGNTGPSWESAHTEMLKDADLKKGLKLVWFATGKDDFLLKTSQATVKMLESNQFDVTYEETEGGHTWINWRENYLPAFLQLLFKP
jgi:enterochelin esterase family protein